MDQVHFCGGKKECIAFHVTNGSVTAARFGQASGNDSLMRCGVWSVAIHNYYYNKKYEAAIIFVTCYLQVWST